MRKLLVTMILLAATTGYAQETPPAGSAQLGKEHFMKYMCYTCHGTVGQGADRGTGPSLTAKLLPFPAFSLQVRTPRLDMPAYRKEFVSDKDLADIYAYLGTVKPGPALKDIPLLKFD